MISSYFSFEEMGMENKFHVIIAVLIIVVLLFCGCTTEQNNLNQDNTNENNETNNGSSEQYDEEEIDPCGNDIGNGNEIIFGQVTPTEWNPDNPFRSLTIHPSDPNIILIGTEANGFVKSINGGQTWVRNRYGLRHSIASGEQLYPEVYDISWSESNPDIIYAATTSGPGPLSGPDGGDGGIYKSTDGGQTWVRKNCGLENEWIFSVHVNPDNSDDVVIGVSGGETTGSWGGIEKGDYFDGGIFR